MDGSDFLPGGSDAVVMAAESVSRFEESIPAKNRDAGSAAILEHARQILARQPTESEREEDEARRRRNAVARIMAPRAPRQPLVFRVTENALVQSDRDCLLAEIRAKSGRGERLTRAERIAVASDKLDTELVPLLKAGRLRAAILELAKDLAAADIANCERIAALEDRIAQLEAGGRE